MTGKTKHGKKQIQYDTDSSSVCSSNSGAVTVDSECVSDTDIFGSQYLSSELSKILKKSNKKKGSKKKDLYELVDTSRNCGSCKDDCSCDTVNMSEDFCKILKMVKYLNNEIKEIRELQEQKADNKKLDHVFHKLSILESTVLRKCVKEGTDDCCKRDEHKQNHCGTKKQNHNNHCIDDDIKCYIDAQINQRVSDRLCHITKRLSELEDSIASVRKIITATGRPI